MTTSAAKYNGWTNYETWNVKLWMDNDEGSYHFWQDAARDALSFCDGDKGDAVINLQTHLRENLEDNAPRLEGCYADILGAALSEVNCYEIAESLIDDVYADWEESHNPA